MVYVSKGPEAVQTAVPSLVGKTVAQAEELLSEAGLIRGDINYEPSGTYSEGVITYQDNTAGELVDIGTKINITVSTGSETDVDPGAGGSGSGNYRYIGSVTIDVNPFYYVGDGEAEIILEMEQNGYGTEIYNEMASIVDFPLTVRNIEGESASIGLVTMYVDGIIFKDEQGNPYVWVVEFEAVEE
jgi:serine/threonine-protein kinase